MSYLVETDELFFGRTGLDPALTQRIVADALSGADDGELFLEYVQAEAFIWDDGKLKSASFETEQGFGLRAVAGETVGFAHSVNLDEHSLRRAAGSVAAVKGGYAGTHALPPQGTNRHLYNEDNPLGSRSFEEKVELLKSIDAYIRSKDPRIAQVSASLSGSWQAVQIIGAGGWRAADIRPLVRLNVSVVTKQGERMEAGSTGYGFRADYLDFFNPEKWHGVADESLRKALVSLESVEAQAGEMPVVLGPGWPAVLLHEAVGHGLEGDANRKKASAFCGLMGQRVAADGVTVVDDGTLEGKRGSITIDDEGTPSQRTMLIEDGILVGFMQDRLNARLMGMTPTGNGRRESFSCQPYPRMTNTMMLGGNREPAEIIASVDKGIYAVDFGGGQVDTTSGKFVFSATEAYEIEGGKIGRPVKGASLVGTGFDVLKQVSMIGNDFALDRGVGSCGKNGQDVPVGIGQPTLKIDKMTVGGSSMG
ncbi:MAG: metalloprotease TldD [Proteobacteria bacterium]|jgi:TldD protein|nr:metalloprotease TldD [Alphaproteobacteria bacterium]NCC03825.1 metalloprotease TldD [Pseudomonadota bacterium]